MIYAKWFNKIKFLLVVLVAIEIVVTISIGLSQAEDKNPEPQAAVGIMPKYYTTFAPIKNAVNQQYTSSEARQSTSNNIKRGVSPAKPKKEKYIKLAISISLLIITVVNFTSLASNVRYCSNCGHSGHMNLISVDNTAYNSQILLMVKVLPLLLYYYSKRGRFRCPRCKRTSTNIKL
jgi:hypothetical protein